MRSEVRMEKENEINKPYHHGNLRQTLIDTGIQYVLENGDNALSIRKLASLCGVTHTAIYNHFKDKESLFEAMKDYVCDQFAASMENEIAEASKNNPQEIAYALGTGYVRFFINNPRYYNFIFSRKDININFDNITAVNSYRPFEVFKNYAIPYLQYRKVPEEDQIRVLIDMWATVHGISGIAILHGTQFSGDWVELTRDILKKNFSIDSIHVGIIG